MSRSVVRWSDDAEKDLRRLDPVNQRRVVRVILRFAENGTGEIKRLQGPLGTNTGSAPAICASDSPSSRRIRS
jgi:mRNA-degrading endonuclease RelE of RelBE toxin-antitoxin system